MKAEAWYRARGRVVRPLVVPFLATFIIGITALTGIQRGMDHKVAWGPTSEQHAISIALSETVYGLHLGYVGFRSVDDKLDRNMGSWDNRRRGSNNDREQQQC